MFRLRQLVFDHVRKYFFFYVLALGFYLLGVIMGSLGVQVMDTEQATELSSFISNYLDYQTAHQLPSAEIIGTLLWSNLKLLIILLIGGLSVWGLILTPFILFIRGFLMGFVAGFFTFDQGLKGVALSAATLFPHSLINILVLLIAAVLSMSMSLSLVRASGQRAGFVPRFGRYLLINVCLAIVMVGTAGLEGYLSPIFVKVVATYLN